MPESAQEWYARVRAGIDRDGYAEAPWSQWPTWPLDGSFTVRELAAPVEEPPRSGEDGHECAQCERSRAEDPSSYVVWRDDLAMLGRPFQETALPFCAFLMPRRHCDLSDQTPQEAARLGELLVHLERAVTQVLDVPRLHVARWGDGAEHLHWWAFARPTGMAQLRGTFLPMWDELLPPADPATFRADLDLVAARLADLAGGEALPLSRWSNSSP